MFKNLRLKVAEWLLPDGYCVDSSEPFDTNNPITMHKIVLGRSSAFNETKNEMIAQHGLATWGEYMYNWVCAKNDETLQEIEAYKKSGKVDIPPYRSDME